MVSLYLLGRSFFIWKMLEPSFVFSQVYHRQFLVKYKFKDWKCHVNLILSDNICICQEIHGTIQSNFNEGEERPAMGINWARDADIKTDADVETHLIALTFSKIPRRYALWSLHLPDDKMVELKYINSISNETECKIIKKRNQTLKSKEFYKYPVVGKPVTMIICRQIGFIT